MDLFRETIKENLKVLSDENKVLFSLLICEKLLPNYSYFSSIYGFGDASKLEAIIKVLYQNVLEEKKLTEKEINSYINEIENITPDTNDYSSILVSFALDACTSIISVLYFLISNDDENIVDVAIYARDTVDMFIQERDDLDLNNKEFEIVIANDSLMINEKDRQIQTIEYLNNSKNNIMLEELREIGTKNIIDVTIFTK